MAVSDAIAIANEFHLLGEDKKSRFLILNMTGDKPILFQCPM
jgi:hypothetical protein